MAQNTLPSDYYLNKALAFIDQMVYCPDHYKRVLAATCAVSYVKWAFSAVPYILATSDEAESGKSTIAFDLPMMLADNMESIDRTTTRDAMNAMWLQRETCNTGWDDIGKIFGANGTNGGLSNFYTQLVRSYKRNASSKMSRNGTTQKVPTYGVAFLNGLQNAVPKDLFTRCIHFRMEPAPEVLAATFRDALDDSTEADAKILREVLRSWAGMHQEDFKRFIKNKSRKLHPKLVSRRWQKWAPLFAVADAAGGMWPQWIMEAFIALELGADEKPKLVPEQFILLDAADWLMKENIDKVFVSDLIAGLRLLPTETGQYCRDVEDEHLIRRVFPAIFGQSRKLTMTARYGDYAGVRGKGSAYDAAPVLEKAIELREMLYPPLEFEPEETDDELEFIPV